MMIGDQPIAALDSRGAGASRRRSILSVKSLKAPDRTGLKTIDIGELDVKSGEIVGIAGISGNGQKEFLEVLAGQRQRDGGEVLVKGSPYRRKPQPRRACSMSASSRRSRCATPARRR